MMQFSGFKSKKDLIARVKDTTMPSLTAYNHCIETSIFGSELKDNGNFCVVLDHPKRTKFASIEVKDGKIVKVS